MKPLMNVVKCMLLVSGLALFFVNCSSGNQVGGDCKDDTACQSGLKCIDGKCTAPGDGGAFPEAGKGEAAPKPIPCKNDLECADGNFCKDGACAKVPDKCTKSEDCGAVRTCKGGKCVLIKCRFDDQCPSGHACNPKTEKCEPAKACDKDKPCAKGWVCNTCLKVCTISTGATKCDYAYNCDGGTELNWCDTCTRECRKLKRVCAACVKDQECGEAEDYCLPDQQNEESGLSFCGRQCNNGICPPGYKCKKFDDPKYKGKSYFNKSQCVPASGDCKKPGECESNRDCSGQGKICDPRSKRCVAGCQVNENCPVRAAGGSCKQDSDCTRPGAKCDNGQCKIQLNCCRGKCGTPCKNDGECDQQEKCKEGCCALEGECRNSKDCPEKQYCDGTTGLCTPGCQTASDCGLPDPKKNRCRFKCRNNKCEEDCRCRNPHIDCTPIRFCPLPADEAKNPLAPCRKPVGPMCKACADHTQCGCKKGDDCKYACTKKECKENKDCSGQPNSATTCYNGRCSTKRVCSKDSDCPSGEKCENKFCAENCNNMCVPFQSGKICVTGCDPLGDGSECPARISCTEMLPQQASGPPCKGKGKACTKNSDCKTPYKNCGPDGYCTVCARGQVCRGLDPKDPLKVICINMPPTVCLAQPALCKEGGF